MVIAQEYLPRRIGLASGLSIGFSIGLGGIAAVVLGALADSVDLADGALRLRAGALPGSSLPLLLPRPGRAAGSTKTATGEATWQRA